MQLALKQLTDLTSNDAEFSPGILLTIAPGASLVLENVSWQAFEKLLLDLGETRAARVAYDRLGVPEVWRYENGVLKIYQLQEQQYLETDISLAFPMFPVQEIIPFIDQHLSLGKKAMRRAFREWVRQKIATARETTGDTTD